MLGPAPPAAQLNTATQWPPAPSLPRELLVKLRLTAGASQQFCLSHRTMSRYAHVWQATALNIEGLSREYCDEFSCSSSPAVENTMRILSRDIQRRGVTRSLYAQTVQYRVRCRRVLSSRRAEPVRGSHPGREAVWNLIATSVVDAHMHAAALTR